jgi:hypothetical protein
MFAGSSAPSGPADGGAPDVAQPEASVVDAGADAKVTADASDAGVCHAVENVGQYVIEFRIAASLPVFEGGPLADGTYVRTESLRFTGVGGATGYTGKEHHQTIVITGGVAQVVFANKGESEDHSTFDLEVMGTELRFLRTCPSGSVDGAVKYSATPTELRIASGADGVNIFTKR